MIGSIPRSIAIAGICFLFFSLSHALQPAQVLGLRSVSSFINTESDSFLFHPEYSVPDDRPPMTSGYTPSTYFKLAPAGTKINWDQSMECAQYNNQWSAHFLVEIAPASLQSRQTREVGLVIYLASRQAREDGTYDIRIEITQEAPNAAVNVYDSAGVKLDGPLPLRSCCGEDLKKPYLPWLDGKKQFYSVVFEERDGKMYFILVQHTKEKTDEYEHTSLLIREMLASYSSHEKLINRPGAYLEDPNHMRCLPAPYVNTAYKALSGGPIFVSWAAAAGALEVMPA